MIVAVGAFADATDEGDARRASPRPSEQGVAVPYRRNVRRLTAEGSHRAERLAAPGLNFATVEVTGSLMTATVNGITLSAIGPA
jgi:hypothetical protein